MARIALTQNKTAIIDDEDLEKVSRYKWTYAPRGGYATRNAYLGGGRKNPIRKTILLHRFILDAPEGLSVDHINHDGLDCRKTNMRLCTHAENTRNKSLSKRNKSGFTGVHYNKRDKKFQANLRINGKLLFLGYHNTPEDAALAYNSAALEHFGQYANLNKTRT